MAAFEPRTAQKESFTVFMKTEPCYNVGDPVICEITITYDNNEEYHLLNRGTPLEGLRSDIFTVSSGGKVIPYDGIMLKRGPPSRDEYIRMKAKTTLDVDLSKAYSFAAGNYTVQLNMNFIFYVDNPKDCSSQAVVSNTVEFKLMESGNLPKETDGSHFRDSVLRRKRSSSKQSSACGPISPKLVGSYPDDMQKRDTRAAYSKAYPIIERSIESTARDTELYKEWFGDPVGRQEVQSNYEKMKSKMEVDEVTLRGLAKETENSIVGRTYGVSAATFKGTSTIYLCDLFFASTVDGEDSKMGTIVHEISHASAARTDDVRIKKDGKVLEAYGKQICHDLARDYPEKARKNGDNYQYFAEAQQDFEDLCMPVTKKRKTETKQSI